MEMWTSMDLDRYSTLIYTKKRLILVEEIDNPEHANENETYPIDYFTSSNMALEIKEEKSDAIEEEFGDVINKNGEIIFIIKEEPKAVEEIKDPIQKEPVPDSIIESLINDSIERSKKEGTLPSKDELVNDDSSIIPYVKSPYDESEYVVEDPSLTYDDYGDEEKKEDTTVERGKKWTPEEEEILKKGYPKHGFSYCVGKLPHRSRKSIEKKIRSMQLTLEKKKK
jgi:hypothetical protein